MKQVKIILLQHVAKLGRIGEVVSVKPGFARNYLLPQGIALRANDANLAYFNSKKAEIEAANAKAKAEAEKLAARMKDLAIIIVRQASEKGSLYGSVSARDIALEISDKGFPVKATQVSIGTPIKELGVYTVALTLHPDVSVDAKVSVGKTEDEGKAQLAAKPE